MFLPKVHSTSEVGQLIRFSNLEIDFKVIMTNFYFHEVIMRLFMNIEMTFALNINSTHINLDVFLLSLSL